MAGRLVKCPDCQGEASGIGPIPSAQMFAARSLSRAISGGHLYRCRQCSLGFRWPQLAPDETDELYMLGDSHTWSTAKLDRKDWALASSILKDVLKPGADVLDVGCFDGGFLTSLLQKFRCHGIEIHADASKRAMDKGIAIVGSDYRVIEGLFDCITSFDVIEHVERPKQFVEICMGALRSGGYLLISTGNLDARSFRFMGSRYWYCAFAEHVSFVSPRWFETLSEGLDYSIERTVKFSHGHASLTKQAKAVMTNIVYRGSPGVFRALRRAGLGGFDVRRYPELADYPPGWTSATDHFMVLLRKH